MSQSGDSSQTNPIRYAFNVVVVGAGVGAGCVTILILTVALGIGLGLDNFFQTKPVFTILLLVGSVPVSLVAMLFIARFAASRVERATTPDPSEEAE